MPPAAILGKWLVVTPEDLPTLDENRIGRVGFPGRPRLVLRRELEAPAGDPVAVHGGVFVVETIVGTTGNVVKARLMRGPEMAELEERLIACLRGWKFEPATYQGEKWAVSWNLTLSVPPARRRPAG